MELAKSLAGPSKETPAIYTHCAVGFFVVLVVGLCAVRRTFLIASMVFDCSYASVGVSWSCVQGLLIAIAVVSQRGCIVGRNVFGREVVLVF